MPFAYILKKHFRHLKRFFRIVIHSLKKKRTCLLNMITEIVRIAKISNTLELQQLLYLQANKQPTLK